MFIGLILASKAWVTWGVVPGIAIGFLLTGGLGWKIIAGVGKFIWSSFLMPGHKHSDRFIDAWEQAFGPIQLGKGHTYPPPGTFQAWYREYRKSNVDPHDWLASMTSGSNFQQKSRHASHAVTIEPGRSNHSYLTANATWDDTTTLTLRKCRGQIIATPKGLVAHELEWRDPNADGVWIPSDNEYRIAWELFRYVGMGTDDSISSKPAVLILDAGLMLYFFVVKEIEVNEIKVWGEYALSHGYIGSIG